MKRNLFFSVMLVLLTGVLSAQTVFDFESLTLPSNGYWNGSDGSGEFGNSEVKFSNKYNADWSSWSDFAFAYDTIVSDKQYAANASSVSGHTFGIGFVPSDWQSGTYDNIPIVCQFPSPVNIQSIDVTNNSKTADVILNGEAGFDPAFSADDYFKIIIEGFYNNQSQGVVNYLLADYTNGNTIVVDTWEELDLSSFGMVDSISFNLESTHTGNYGMNTPAYFCIDNLTYSAATNISDIQEIKIKVYPNPCSDFIQISENANVTISDISGKLIFSDANYQANNKIYMNNFSSGIYFVKANNEVLKVIKK